MRQPTFYEKKSIILYSYLLPATLVQSQLVEIVHRGSRGPPKDVHRLPVDDGNVAIPWDRRRPFRAKRHPKSRLQIEGGGEAGPGPAGPARTICFTETVVVTQRQRPHGRQEF